MLLEKRVSLRIGNTLPSRGWHPLRLHSNKERSRPLVGHFGYILLEMVNDLTSARKERQVAEGCGNGNLDGYDTM